jgi:signal transduction histidine kinase
VREKAKQWGWLVVMATLCAVLALLQYRWTGELSQAEQARLGSGLDEQLRRMARSFDQPVRDTFDALLPDERDVANSGLAAAQALAFQRWQRLDPRPQLFRRIAVATPHQDSLSLALLNQETGAFNPLEWPPEWQTLRAAFEERRTAGHLPPRLPPDSLLHEFPIFAPGTRNEIAWMIFEFDARHLWQVYWPAQIRTHLNPGDQPDFDVLITAGREQQLLYSTLPNNARFQDPDARAQLLNGVRRGPPGGPFGKKKGPEGGRWTLAAKHRQGSLDAAVRANRWRNLAVAGGLLLLIAAAGGALVHNTNKARRLAQMEFDFVAGVTHEFRTPLTVIRGAGHNLLSGVVQDPSQRERYLRLIVQHAESLTEMVEQVLGFAGARGGRAKNIEEPVWILDAINEGLEAAAGDIEAARCEVDIQAPPEIPPVLGDPVALRRAFQNLLANAAKHGGEGGWIGLTVEVDQSGPRPHVLIRVRDRGPGIPAEELAHLFEPFYRGERAKADQVRGTGLGLSLVATIAEAHGGSVAALNLPEGGAEFTLRLPAALPEQYDEFANPAR